jgi:hypothetical protein
VERGHAIGRLAELPEDQLRALEASGGSGGAPDGGSVRAREAVDALLGSVRRFNPSGLRRDLGRLAALQPPRLLVREIVLPFLAAVGDAWHDGSLRVAQEHLASAAIRDVLGAVLRVHALDEPPATLVFGTPPGERHEFGALAAAILAAGGGLGAVYLGPDLPPEEIASAVERSGARVAVLSVLGSSAADGALSAIAGVAARLPRATDLWIGGPAYPLVVDATARAGGRHLADFDAFEQALAGLGARF